MFLAKKAHIKAEERLWEILQGWGACLKAPLMWSCWYQCRKWGFEPMVRVEEGNRSLITVLSRA